MSKNINVNPGQYKVGGRERQGEDVVHEIEKQKIGRQRAGSSKRLSAKTEAQEKTEHPPASHRSKQASRR